MTLLLLLLPPVGLTGVIGRRFSVPVPPVAPSRVSLGDVAGVRMPRLSYFPLGEPANDDEDDDELEEEDAAMRESRYKFGLL